MIQVRVRDRPDRETIEAVDGRAGEREQDGRVRRDDELRVALDQIEQMASKPSWFCGESGASGSSSK